MSRAAVFDGCHAVFTACLPYRILDLKQHTLLGKQLAYCLDVCFCYFGRGGCARQRTVFCCRKCRPSTTTRASKDLPCPDLPWLNKTPKHCVVPLPFFVLVGTKNVTLGSVFNILFFSFQYHDRISIGAFGIKRSIRYLSRLRYYAIFGAKKKGCNSIWDTRICYV
jgi:hypothetical protein